MIKNERDKSTFFQWDTNQKIRIWHSEVDSVVQLHFAGSGDRTNEALVVTPTIEDGVIHANIPNLLLQYAGKIFIYLYCQSCDGMYSVLAGSVTVLPREKPSDYIYTETDVLKWAELDARILQLEEDIENAGAGGIHIGDDEPDDDTVVIWVDTDENSSSGDELEAIGEIHLLDTTNGKAYIVYVSGGSLMMEEAVSSDVTALAITETELTDRENGKTYYLYVENGKLKLHE